MKKAIWEWAKEDKFFNDSKSASLNLSKWLPKQSSPSDAVTKKQWQKLLKIK